MVDNAVPSIRQMANQFVTDIGHIEGDGAGHNHGTGIVCHPQFMDNRSHQAQHATCTLEALQRCPIIVQAIKYFRMNRVAGHHTVPILNFLSFQREICRVFLIHLAECRTYGIARGLVLAVKEQSAAHNLKALVGCNRLPDGLHTPKGMLNRLQRNLTGLTANFNGRLRDRSNHDAVIAGARSLSNFLNKGDEVVIRASGQARNAVEFLCISNQLVHQNQAMAALVQQCFQGFRSGGNTMPVSFTNQRIQVWATGRGHQLIGHLAPDRVDRITGQIGRVLLFVGVKGCTHQHRHICFRQFGQTGFIQNRLQAGNLIHRDTTLDHVVQRQHTMGLTAAERCFQLDDRLTADTGNALQRFHQQARHTLGNIGAGKKLHRVTVLKSTFSAGNLCQVSGKFRRLVASFCYIGMGLDNLSPAG